MAPGQLKLLAADSMLSEFKAGEWILKEVGPANRFYLILEGRVELESSVANGETVHIQTLDAGDVLAGRGSSRRITGISTRGR
jgi:CRP-like cAMP-binding protein